MQRRSAFSVYTLAFFFGAATFVFSANLATAQSIAAATDENNNIVAEQTNPQPSAEGDVALQEADAGVSEQYLQSLKMVLGNCFGNSLDASPDATASIGFNLDEQGRLSGLPKYLGAAEVTAHERSLFLNAAAVLDKCAPFPPEGRPVQFTVVIASNDIQTLTGVLAHKDAQGSVRQNAEVAVNKAGTAETEAKLRLRRADRIEIQRRLMLLKIDPKGIDGVFGQGTRNAISDWQTTKRFPATGFLNAVQLLALNAQSQAKYASFIAKPRQQKKKRRVKVCRNIGLLGIQTCQYEYR